MTTNTLDTGCITELDLLTLTAQIVGQSGTAINPAAQVKAVYAALKECISPAAAEPEPLVPAVPVRKSIAHDYIICLEDGKKFKSLKRHLRGLGMTPDEYRAKWGLPADYPMVAPSYSEKRSQLAKDNGLGRKPEMRAAA